MSSAPTIDSHEFVFEADDGARIAAYRWSADTRPVAVLQIAHGMGEHAARYLAPLRPLIEAGVVVYANDHRGHGRTAGSPDELGNFGPGGFAALRDDMVQLTMLAMKEHPELPLILLGHSMGSFAAQLYVLDNSALIDGLVLSGSAALDLLAQAAAATGAAGLEAFNAPFEPARTPFDWLSRDAAEVDAYIADPLCGFSAQPESLISMFLTAEILADHNALRQIRRDLPIYLFAGDADPINGGLAFLQPVIDRYRAAGLTEIQTDFYPAGRHEMLNETNRDEVVGNLWRWMQTLLRG